MEQHITPNGHHSTLATPWVLVRHLRNCQRVAMGRFHTRTQAHRLQQALQRAYPFELEIIFDPTERYHQ